MLGVSRSCDPLTALAGIWARPGAAPPRSRSASRLLRGKGAPLWPLPLRGAGLCLARRGGGRAAVSPALVFPPAPPFRRRPFSSADHRPGGKPIPVRSLRSLAGGNRTAAIFVYGAAAWKVPPPEIPPPLMNTPVPPQSCGGRSHTPQTRRGSHCSGASVVVAVHARPSANRSRRLRAWPAPIDLRAVLRPFRRSAEFAAGRLAFVPRGTRRARPLESSRPVTSGCGCAARSVAVPGMARRVRVRFVSKPNSCRGLWKTKRCERGGA